MINHIRESEAETSNQPLKCKSDEGRDIIQSDKRKRSNQFQQLIEAILYLSRKLLVLISRGKKNANISVISKNLGSFLLQMRKCHNFNSASGRLDILTSAQGSNKASCIMHLVQYSVGLCVLWYGYRLNSKHIHLFFMHSILTDIMAKEEAVKCIYIIYRIWGGILSP